MSAAKTNGAVERVEARDLRSGDVLQRNGFGSVVYGDPIDFGDGTRGVYFRNSAAIVLPHDERVSVVRS